MSVQTVPGQPDTRVAEMVHAGESSPEMTDATLKRYRIFNRRDVIAEGWYWVLQSHRLKRGQVKAINIAGKELAIYRGKDDGRVVVLDAYCPHMGSHLAEGKVEGDQLRCFFHNWRYNAQGECTDIPCATPGYPVKVSTRVWHVQETHGLIWIWFGKDAPTESVPEVPEFAGRPYESSLGNLLFKNCHPNVVMINAIDEQHFKTVHHLPGEILSLRAESKRQNRIEFSNQGAVPTTSLFGKIVALFYRNKLTYDLNYWQGSNGTLTLGPDFLHLHLMFALRLTPEGRTEGQMIVFTPKRKGPLGWLFNRFILQTTKIASAYFASGDTRVFQTIRFNLKNPTPADRSLLAFINHLEKQEAYALV